MKGEIEMINILPILFMMSLHTYTLWVITTKLNARVFVRLLTMVIFFLSIVIYSLFIYIVDLIDDKLSDNKLFLLMLVEPLKLVSYILGYVVYFCVPLFSAFLAYKVLNPDVILTVSDYLLMLLWRK